MIIISSIVCPLISNFLNQTTINMKIVIEKTLYMQIISVHHTAYCLYVAGYQNGTFIYQQLIYYTRKNSYNVQKHNIYVHNTHAQNTYLYTLQRKPQKFK